ncbi:hypothetical protein TNCV_3319481 [Trichonephila clavipes]|nr:hypothetical protein TNCV_3319481 [Trichonephila clavipes]
MEAHEIYHGKTRFTTDVNSSLEHHANDSTILVGPTPILRENTPEGGQRVCHFSSPSTNRTRKIAARRIFRVPSCQTTKHLQTSMPSSGFEPRPDATAVSVNNYERRWPHESSLNVKK